jgi:hypothetical protein
MILHRRALLAAVCALSIGAAPALAQATTTETAEDPGKLLFQLNNAQTVSGDCQVTFAIRNNTAAAIDKSAYKMAIVDANGQVTTLITFEFLPLPVGKTKVQQFSLTGQACESISAMSINDFSACVTAEAPTSPVCEQAIELSNKTKIQFPWEL